MLSAAGPNGAPHYPPEEISCFSLEHGDNREWAVTSPVTLPTGHSRNGPFRVFSLPMGQYRPHQWSSFVRGRWLKQKPITGHILSALSHKWDTSITPLLPSLRDHHGGGRDNRNKNANSFQRAEQSVTSCAGLRAEIWWGQQDKDLHSVGTASGLETQPYSSPQNFKTWNVHLNSKGETCVLTRITWKMSETSLLSSTSL